MADVPHFALPFRFRAGGHAEVNEQDSPRDVAACVEAVLRTRPGQRLEHPAFGVSDPTFRQLPAELDGLARQAEAWEPRASVLVEEDPDTMADAVARARFLVTQED